MADRSTPVPSDSLPVAPARRREPHDPEDELRLVLLVPDGSHEPLLAGPVLEILKSSAFEVHLVEAPQWQPEPLTGQDPVVIVEAPGSALDRTLKLIQLIKTPVQGSRGELHPNPTLVAVIVEPDSGMATWPMLQAAGADAVLFADAPALVVISQFRLLSRHALTTRHNHHLEEQLERQAQIDDTSQVYNRRYFFSAAHREVSRSRRYHSPLSCLMVDIDQFRALTARYGYLCCDMVLRTVGGVLKQWTRESDLVARFGDSKFVVLLVETDLQAAGAVQEKIHHALASKSIVCQGQHVPVEVFIGEAELRPESEAPPAEDTADYETLALSTRERLADLLEDADAALRVARKAARPTFVEYHPSAPGPLGSTPDN